MKTETPKIREYAGRQLKIGDTAFQVPSGPPKTDAEVIDRCEAIAKIELAIQPHRWHVKAGEAMIKYMHESIDAAFAARLKAETQDRQESLPGVADDGSGLVTVSDGERSATVTGTQLEKAAEDAADPAGKR